MNGPTVSRNNSGRQLDVRRLVPLRVSSLSVWLGLIALLATACSGPDSTGDDFSATPTATSASDFAGPTPSATTAASEPTPENATPTSPPEGATASQTPADSPSTTPSPEADSPSPTPGGTAVPEAPTATSEPPGQEPTFTSPPVASNPDPLNASIRFEQIASGFLEPTLLTHAGDGTGTLYVTEKRGAIFTHDGALFMDITDRVINTGLAGNSRELGFLGLVFHPAFESNGQFYVHYNDRNGDTVISAFRTGANGLGDPSSEQVLLTMDQPEDHFNGGTILFGPDGYLYIAMGTGGNREEDHLNSQDLGSLFGKILRIDVDNGDPYAIPPDNPYLDTPGARPEVWAYGLRNPWRFDFDEATGDMYIAEPGQFGFEWIHFQSAGPDGTPPGAVNYGWPIYEGFHCFDIPSETTSDASNCSPPENYQAPILEYPRGQNGGCVIIGGSVYRGAAIPNLQGAYLYSDFCSAVVYAAWRDVNGAWQTTSLIDLPGLVSSFGEDESGNVYVLSISDGTIYQIAPD